MSESSNFSISYTTEGFVVFTPKDDETRANCEVLALDGFIKPYCDGYITQQSVLPFDNLEEIFEIEETRTPIQVSAH